MLQENFSFRSFATKDRYYIVENAIILHARVVVELILSETTGVVCWPIGLAHEAVHAQPPHVVWCLVTSSVGHITGITSFGGGSLFYFIFRFFLLGELRLRNRSGHRPPQYHTVVLQERGRGVRHRPDTETKKNKRKR